MLSRLLFVRWWTLLAVVVLPSVLFDASSAWAEGSRSLYPVDYLTKFPGGFLANLDVSAPGSKYLNRVKRSAFLYVYAQASEYILLGSNTRGDPAATKGDIRVYNPQYFGTPGDETIPTTSDFTCSGGSTEAGPHYFGGTKGIIATRAKELAGPNSADNSASISGGFEPTRLPMYGPSRVVKG